MPAEISDERSLGHLVPTKHAKKIQNVLFALSRAQLMQQEAEHVTARLIQTSGCKGVLASAVNLRVLIPRIQIDGVSVDIPLPVLNQVSANGFDWQVPALREALVIALIKSLPKAWRRNFVPAPNYPHARFVYKL